MPDEIQHKSKAPGCALAAVIAIAMVCLLGWWFRHEQEQARLTRLRQDAARSAEFVQQVKDGDDGSRIFFGESLLAGKLAADPQCVTNLRRASFFMADLSDPGYAQVRRLTNVRELSFYDCGSIGTFLTNLKSMPSIETISFGDTKPMGDEEIPILASFPNLKKVHLGHDVRAAERDIWEKTLPNAEIEIENEEQGE